MEIRHPSGITFHVHGEPIDATSSTSRAPLPPRRRAQDQIADAASLDAFDYAVDRGWQISFAEVSQICRVYHAQLAARGGRL